MKKIFLLIASVFVIAALQAQKIDASAVPAPVKDAFQKAYPSIKTVKWEKEKANYEANFREGSTEETAAYDASGKLIQTEKEISPSALPNTIVDYLAKNLSGKKVKEATEIKSAAGVITYEAEVNEVDYTFDASGKLLKKEADED